MHLAVEHIHTDITGKRTCKRSFAHLLHYTLENCRHEPGIDGTSDNTVVELELAAPVKVETLLALDVEHHFLAVHLELVGGFNPFHNRADEKMHFTELACTSGLLLVTVVCDSNLGDGLPVGNLRREHLDLDLVLVLESPSDDIDVLLALSLEDSLLEFLGVFNYDGRVFCRHLCQSLTHLFLVLLLLCLDGCTELGCRELDMLIRDVASRLCKCHIGLCRPELDSTSDVSGKQVRDFLFLLSCHGIDGGNPLLVASLGVLEILTFRQLSRHHLEICNLTEMRLHCRLIYEECSRGILLALHLVSVLCHCLPVSRRRSHLDGELHEPLDSYVLLCRQAEHRQHLACLASDAYTLADLVLGQHTCLEELLHQGIIIFCRPFDERRPELFSLCPVLFRNFQVFPGPVLVLEMIVFHLEDIYESVE